MSPYETLASIALAEPGATRVFSRHKLDYCCGGQMTLEEACSKKGLKPSLLLAEIATEKPAASAIAPDVGLAALTDHIVKRHHWFTRDIMDEILALGSRVQVVHGGEHPELAALNQIFREFEKEMTLHMRKEEEILFPFIRLLSDGRQEQAEVCFPTVQAPIRMMLHEHDSAANDLRSMREITNDYALPASACTKYRILFARLQELEADVHEHMHLENNLLFPRAVEAEQVKHESR